MKKTGVIWKQFKSWMLGVSVRLKIMGIATACILILGMAMTLQVRWWLIHHMDLSGVDISREIARGFTFRFMGVTIFVALLGMLIAYLLTDIMTKPILKLVKLSQAVTRGQLDQRAEMWANDEVGELTHAFNEMITAMEYSVHALQQKNDELIHLSEELRQRDKVRAQLLQKLITAQEEERQRVARELHDQTSQYLTALSLGLKALELEGAPFEERQERTKQLQEIVSQLMKDIHSLSWELRPAALDDWGLNTALQRYTENLSQRSGVSIDFHSRGFSDSNRLSMHIETALYRIIQEALINTIKHAAAKQVSVLLERFPDSIMAIVEDDGTGFDVEAVMLSPKIESKLGLLGMQERSALVGGTLTVESTSGMGTTVFVKIPI